MALKFEHADSYVAQIKVSNSISCIPISSILYSYSAVSPPVLLAKSYSKVVSCSLALVGTSGDPRNVVLVIIGHML